MHHPSNHQYTELTHQIIGAYYRVYNTLGHGFLESVYRNAMVIELHKEWLAVQTEEKIDVFYEDRLVGNFRADIVEEGKIIIELKAVESLHKKHEVQLVNYLRATNIEVGLRMNFGQEAKFIRRVLSNDRKKSKG